MEEHFHLRAAAQPARGWAVLLPGASGLKIFEDDQHYFRAADALNQLGWDAMVIDYKRAYFSAAGAPKLTTGGKIAWVTEQAIAWARAQGALAHGPGVVVAWSLGAEGIWPLVTTDAKAASLGVVAAICFYPSTEEWRRGSPSLPVLIETGAEDDVTRLRDIKKALDTLGADQVSMHVHEGAHHGFDISSLREQRTVRVLPLVGPKGTFAYNESAALAAWANVREFLAQYSGAR